MKPNRLSMVSLVFLVSLAPGLSGCVPEDSPLEESACRFPINGEVFGDTSGGTGETGGDGGDGLVDFSDVVAVCSYKAVYDANQLAGGAPEPFHITPECESALEQAI